MATLVLLRHGRSTANTAGILAGRSEGVGLDDAGLAQAQAAAGRLAGITFDALVSSPLQRCRQTVAPLAEALGLPVRIDDRFAEVDYGEWTGRKLNELGKEKLWGTVQAHPSAAIFPGGEGLAQVSARAVAGVRELVGSVDADGVVLVCSHGDVIKAILADALGLHLDGFQRIVVAPASLSVVRYTSLRPFVERINDAGDLGTLRPPPKTDEDAEKAEADPAAGNEARDEAGDRQPESNHPAPAADSDAVPGGVTR